MKNFNIKNFAAGFVVGAVLLSGVGMASTHLTSIDVNLNPISIKYNGEAMESQDVASFHNGNETIPTSFIYKGTTYVPVRFIVEGMGKEVEWQADTRTIVISDRASQGFFDIEGPKQTPDITTEDMSSLNFSVSYYEPNVSSLPDEVQKWVEENYTRIYRGTFEHEGKTYVLISRGQAPNPGYGIDVKDVVANDKQIVVKGEFTSPDPDMFYSQVITYPAVVIELEKSSKELSFQIIE